MDDELFPKRDQPRASDPKEGVRIIGAEEAQAAIDREDVARRLPEDAPRFGDRPESPPPGGPRPAIRFPLSGTSDPRDIERPAVVPIDPPRSGEVVMPHWSAPATGEVPKVFATGDEPEDDLDAWSSFSTSQPRWRGEGPAHEPEDLDDFSRLADDDTRIGALDPDRPAPDDYYAFEPEPEHEEDAVPVTTRSISSGQRRARTRAASGAGYDRPVGAGRDLQAAVGVGVGLAVLFLLFAKLGPKYVMVLVAVVATLAVVELYTALRHAGYHSATLLGIVATPALALGAYWKGEAAFPVVLFLTVGFGLLWYLVGAGGEESAVSGLSTTLLGVGYVGVLAAFAALELKLPSGVGVLYGAILATVGYDIGGFFVGRSLGSRPMSEASPNKTVEGLAGGWIGAVLLGGIVAGFIHPWSDLDLTQKLLFGVVAAVAATLGDLCESLLKRDLGVKDMGTILPGHGGILDRFDAMLFVLPATYYAARILIFHV